MHISKLIGGILLAAASFATTATAADYPSQPITLVVPYSAGGNVDVTARILQGALGDSLGQPVVVENRPGGGGMIAGSYVARAEPDGYTLFIASGGPITFGPLTREDAPYKWDTSFEVVSNVSFGTNLMLVRSSFPADTVEEFIEYAKANPGDVTVGVSSPVSSNHFLGLLFANKAGIEWNEIVFKGNAPAVTALVGEQIDAGFMQVAAALPHIRSGKLKVLAAPVANRSQLLPDVPTLAEAGVPGVEGINFVGVFAPKGTPEEIVSFLDEKIQAAMAKEEPQEKLAGIGSEVPGLNSEGFREFLISEDEKWIGVIEMEKNAK